MESPRFPLPPTRRLIVAWGILASLTAGSMVAALGGFDAHTTKALGLGPAAVLMILSGLKAREILSVYLNLRASSGDWRGFFAALVGVILGAVLAGHLLIAALLS